jgi:hypothetical protein
MAKAKKNRAVLERLSGDPVQEFCGIFKDGPSLTETLLAQRKKEREHGEKGSDDCKGKARVQESYTRRTK